MKAPFPSLWNEWAETPIRVERLRVSDAEEAAIREGSALAEFIETDRIQLDHTYRRLRLKGTLDRVFTRKVVLDRIQTGSRILPPDWSIVIFDAFRTIECQYDLLRWMAEDARRRNPKLSVEESWVVSRQFVADPDDKDRPTVPTHNSGGAVDLGFFFEGRLVDFGTEFDEPVDRSNTIALETGPMTEAVRNRRRLFHFMSSLGFTNLSSEWWHYDLGDLLWSRQTGYPTEGRRWIFESIEKEVMAAIT